MVESHRLLNKLLCVSTMPHLDNKSIVLCFLAVALNGCVANNYCRDSYDSQRVICISEIEIVTENSIRVVKESEGCPVYFTDKNGNNIDSNVLHISDSISISDEHYGASFTITDIKKESIALKVSEGWSYPVSGWCTSGELNDTIKITPYNNT